MWATMVVELPPALDDGSGLAQAPEPLAIEVPIAQLPFEALDETLFQGLPGGMKAGPAAANIPVRRATIWRCSP
jgi:hypothetical protein